MFFFFSFPNFFQVINLYLDLLKERELREPSKFLKCHFFNTFFYKKVCPYILFVFSPFSYTSNILVKCASSVCMRLLHDALFPNIIKYPPKQPSCFIGMPMPFNAVLDQMSYLWCPVLLPSLPYFVAIVLCVVF